MRNDSEKLTRVEDESRNRQERATLLKDNLLNFDTATSLLLILYADIKSYRPALYSFAINVRNAIPTLLAKLLPISLVP